MTKRRYMPNNSGYGSFENKDLIEPTEEVKATSPAVATKPGVETKQGGGQV